MENAAVTTYLLESIFHAEWTQVIQWILNN